MHVTRKDWPTGEQTVMVYRTWKNGKEVVEAETLLLNLSLLVSFLNQDYDDEGFAKWHNKNFLFGSLYRPHLEKRRSIEGLRRFNREVKRVQTEIRRLLEPTVAQDGGTAATAKKYLQELFRYLNTYKPSFLYAVREPSAPHSLRIRARESFPEYGEKTFRLPGGEKWVLRRAVPYVSSLREHVCGLILSLAEDDWLERLRRCGECGRFFVAKDLKEKFCSLDCYRIKDRKAALERVRKHRRRKREALKKAEQKKVVQAFGRFLEKAGRNDPSVWSVVKAIGQGDPLKGWKVVNALAEKQKARQSPETIWRSLDERIREVLRENLL